VNILIAEDDPFMQEMLGTLLGDRGYSFEMVSDGRAALEKVTKSDAPPDMIIMDWLMPELDGVDVCRAIRQLPDSQFCYIILLSGKDATKDVVEGLDAGADDYLSKPYHPDELLSRIRAGERIVTLQRTVADANDRLNRLANTDSLTQLMNRPAIVAQLDREITRAKRTNVPLAVVMSDVDHFKDVNDTHGHGVGDAVLEEFARRIGGFVRKYDSVGRYGGEEFLILLPGLPAEAAARVVERFREKICEAPVVADGAEVAVTASFGVAWFKPESLCDAKHAVNEADILLYAAKNGGRNRVECEQFVGPAPEAASPH
jgi:diguanylate cyclase (GGDEF)-like protein